MNFEPEPELKKIVSDNKSGSAEVLAKLNEYLLKNFSKTNLDELVPYLKKEFSEFSNIQNYLNSLKRISFRDNRKLNSFFENFEIKNSLTITGIYRNSFDVFKNFRKFITISNSKTLENFFALFAKDFTDVSITICESRPIFEGRTFAKNLLKYKINIKLITEAMIANEIQNIDAAVIGADSILSNGNVVNKVGSKLLAIACKYYNKPFYVLAGKSKFAGSINYSVIKKDKNEIWDSKPGSVKIDNYYFEVVNNDFITKIFTD